MPNPPQPTPNINHLSLSQTFPNPNLIRTSDIITSMSYALDITEGQPEGHAVRNCLIGMKVADVIQLSSEDRAALFYALLLKDLGCSSNSAKIAWLFRADDQVVKRDVKLIDNHNPLIRGIFALRHVWPEGSWWQKLVTVFGIVRKTRESAVELIQARCERGAEIARYLGFPEATAQAILALDEHWNGGGYPLGLKGHEIPLLGRICCLAQTAEVLVAHYGADQAMKIVRQRRKKWFDPDLVDALLSVRKDRAFWASLTSADTDRLLRDLEPEDYIRTADEKMIDRIAEGFARVIDAKSPWTYRHSEGVAALSVRIAETLGWNEERCHELWRAGLLHDIGKLAISNRILDKPGKLTPEEFELIKTHTIHSLKILQRVSCFHPFADYTSAHHERLDGKGYHRGLKGDQIWPETRVLTVADICEALSASRPYRPGMPIDQIMNILRKDAGIGLCPVVIEAMISFEEQTGFLQQLCESDDPTGLR